MAQCKIKGNKGQFRRNSEMYSFYNDLNVVDNIKIGREGWAGHIIGKEDEMILKKVVIDND